MGGGGEFDEHQAGGADERRRLAEELQAMQMAALARGHKVAVETESVPGSPAEAIVDYAAGTPIDLIVIVRMVPPDWSSWFSVR